MLWFILGLIIGGNVGFIVCALCCVNKDKSNRSELSPQEKESGASNES